MSRTGVLFVVSTMRKALQKSHLWISACNEELFPNKHAFFFSFFLNHDLIELSIQNACVTYSLGSKEQCTLDHCKTHAQYHVSHSAYIIATEVHSDSMIIYTEEFHSHSLTSALH